MMRYDKAVEVENLKENAQKVLLSVDGLTPDDAMNALGAAVSQVVINNWQHEARADLLDAWFSMVFSSVVSIR